MKISRKDIIYEAKSWLATPYQHQASVKHAGCDCLGLIRGVYKNIYGFEPEATPPYIASWAEASGKELIYEACKRHLIEINIEDIKPADILVFRWKKNLPAKHLSILSSENQMIHSYENTNVCIAPLNGFWHNNLAYAFKFPNLTD